MLASALRRHGATDEQMPLTKAGKPYRGGYAHHPCTVWAGDSRANFSWLALHMARMRHAVEFEEARYTPFAQAMPDEYRDDDAVKAYRAYYHSKQFAKWEKGTPAPDWWRGVEVSA